MAYEWDVYAAPLFKVVRQFGDEALDRLARQVRYRMMRMPASGVYDDAEPARTIWAEWLIECRDGPTDALAHAWDHLLYQATTHLIDALPQSSGKMCSIVASWERDGDTRELADDPAIDSDLIRDAVVNRLKDWEWRGRANPSSDRDG